MNLNKIIRSWKYPFMLLAGIGISNLGEWIYFIALNLIVLDMTGSALAVSGLYIVKPLATIFTNFWAGSLIDRLNKRRLMIFLDVIRSLFILLLPIMSSIILIYVVVFMINMASSIFGPVSMTYITKLIPEAKRKQFNAVHSLVTSGAFLMGPALAGLLFLVGNPTFAIYINSIALLLSSVITFFMPNVEETRELDLMEDLSIKNLFLDFKVVMKFSLDNKFVLTVCLLFSLIMVVMASAIDSLEAAFAKDVLLLSDAEYGALVSIAGLGIVVGAMLNTLIVRKLNTSILIGIGSIFVSTGYIIYAFSSTFLIAGVGFFILAFFISFANTGFLTFYQKNIPTDIMGRVGSVYGLIEAVLIIIATVLMGLATLMIEIQMTVIIGVMMMFIFSLVLWIITSGALKERVLFRR